MKKMVKAALAAALVCFSSSLFAAEPVSFLKGTTFGLFEDETVDNLAWGVEDADGLVLGGYDDGIDLGIGARIGDLWWSIYDTANISTSITTQQTVNNDSVAKDGINTDYVDVTKSTSKNNTTNNIWNDLYLSFAGDDWGVQSYWLYSNYATGLIGKQTSEDESHSAGTKTSSENKYNRYNGTNTFGANFKGIGLSEMNDADLYLQLNMFQVQWSNSSEKHEYKNTWKQNGAAYSAAHVAGQDDYDSYSYKKNNNRIWPAFEAEMGFNLPDFGALSTKFVLTDSFNVRFGWAKATTVTTDVVETNFSKSTTKTTKTVADGNSDYRFRVYNSITPKLVFDFDVGERVKVKASAEVGVITYNTPATKKTVTTTVTTTENYDKVTHLKNSSYQKTVNYTGDQYEDNKFTTSLAPETTLAVVYEVKPEKFNLNFGLSWNAGYLSWVTTTRKNVVTKDTNYKTSTNTAGDKTVEIDTVTYSRRDTSADQANDAAQEYKNTVYTANFTGTPKISIGSNWFLNDKVQLDMAYTGAFKVDDISVMGNGTDSLLENSFAIQLSVKF